MANFLYVDNSNVWIEGMHASAVAKGVAPDIWTAMEHRICDYDWKLDFGRLYEFAGGAASDVGRAVLYGSSPDYSVRHEGAEDQWMKDPPE
jgi:hypothetical protein